MFDHRHLNLQSASCKIFSSWPSSQVVTFYLKGNLHDLQDIGWVFLQQTNFSNGEILFEFLHREVHTLQKINLYSDTMFPQA